MPDQEKITINMSAVDLGKIDLLVQEGLYSNRTDFIRTAIRNLLDKHNLEIQQSVTRHSYLIGALVYDKSNLEEFRARGEKIKMALVGFLHLNNDISPELARQVIESIQVRGIFHASPEVKAALADRMK
ncbi:MAG: CopG family transcriptional regulator [Anaerolineales bacterium]|jgi:Arc/MetJ-type ribon-helix-helix transcriptional regulator